MDPFTIAAIGSVASAVIGAGSTAAAADTAAGASAAAAEAHLEGVRLQIEAMEQQNEIAQAQIKPWNDVGLGALAQLAGYNTVEEAFPNGFGNVPANQVGAASQSVSNAIDSRTGRPVDAVATPQIDPNTGLPYPGRGFDDHIIDPNTGRPYDRPTNNLRPGDVPSSGNDFAGLGSFEAAYRAGLYNGTSAQADAEAIAQEQGLTQAPGAFAAGQQLADDQASLAAAQQRVDGLSQDVGDPEFQQGDLDEAAAEVERLTAQVAQTQAVTQGAADYSVPQQQQQPVAPQQRGVNIRPSEFTTPDVYQAPDEFKTPLVYKTPDELKSDLIFDPSADLTTPLTFDPSADLTTPLTYDPGEFGEKFEFDASDLYNDPGYQFRREQGEKAINRARASGGSFISGARAQDFADYNQGLAEQRFNTARNEQYQDFVRRGGVDRDVFGTRVQDRGIRLATERDVFGTRVQDRGTRLGTERDVFGTEVANRGAQLAIDQNEFASRVRDRDARLALDVAEFDSRTADRAGRLNYLMNLSGVGQGAAAQGANLSSNLGSNIGAARATSGNNLAGIYQDAGNTRAQLQLQGGAAVNNAIQGGLSNYLALTQQNKANAQIDALTANMNPPVGNRADNYLSGPVQYTGSTTPVVGYTPLSYGGPRGQRY